MTSAPGSWSPGLQGLNARGALKVDLGCADGVEVGQNARPPLSRPARIVEARYSSERL